MTKKAVIMCAKIREGIEQFLTYDFQEQQHHENLRKEEKSPNELHKGGLTDNGMRVK